MLARGLLIRRLLIGRLLAAPRAGPTSSGPTSSGCRRLEWIGRWRPSALFLAFAGWIHWFSVGIGAAAVVWFFVGTFLISVLRTGVLFFRVACVAIRFGGAFLTSGLLVPGLLVAVLGLFPFGRHFAGLLVWGTLLRGLFVRRAVRGRSAAAPGGGLPVACSAAGLLLLILALQDFFERFAVFRSILSDRLTLSAARAVGPRFAPGPGLAALALAALALVALRAVGRGRIARFTFSRSPLA